MEQDKAELVRRFITELPYSRALGLRLEALEPGEATLSLPFAPGLVGDPAKGVLHGGAVSALMDTCAGAAVMSHAEGGLATATLDLRIDYMRAARPGEAVHARALCYHVTRSVAFVRATAWDAGGGSDEPVASAAGAFTVTAAPGPARVRGQGV